MPRRNRRAKPKPRGRTLPRDGGAFFGARQVEGPRWDFGRPYIERTMGAASAQKTYICPGCNSYIPPRMSHIVAWPVDRDEDRRHWHTRCWQNR